MAKKPKERGFAVGDRVTWQSQAAGSWTTKLGTVVAVVPAGCSPDVMLSDDRFFQSLGSARKHTSYVVEVQPAPTRNPVRARRTPAKPVLYWPIASKLTRVRKAKS